MALILKKGAISHLKETTNSIARNGNMNTLHSWAFRIDDMPVKLQSGTHSSLSEGDVITAVGQFNKGVLEICAFRNETTGAYDEANVTVQLIMSICFLILGVPLSLFIVGLPLLFFGIKGLRAAYIAREAKNMLRHSLYQN